MTVAVVQSRGLSSSTFTFASTPTVGHCIVVAGMNNNGSGLPSAPPGLSWESVAAKAAGNDFAGLFWKVYASGDGNSFTIGNMGGTVGTYGWELSGTPTVGTLAGLLPTSNTPAAGTGVTVTLAGTTPTDDSIGISVVAANTTFTTPAVTGYSNVVKVVNPGAVAWKTFTAQQTNPAAVWSWTGTVSPVGLFVSIKGTTVSTPPPSASLRAFVRQGTDMVEAEVLVNQSGVWA